MASIDKVTIESTGQTYDIGMAEAVLQAMYPIGIIVPTTGTTLPGLSTWKWERIEGEVFFQTALNEYNTGIIEGSNTLTDVPAHEHGAGSLIATGGSHIHDVHLKFNKDGASGSGSVNRVTPSPNIGTEQSSPYKTDAGGTHTHSITGSTASAGNTGGVDIRPRRYLINAYRLISYT